MVDPGYEPRQFGLESTCLTATPYGKGPGGRKSLIPVICVAIAWSLTVLSLHFLIWLLGRSKIKMPVKILCKLWSDTDKCLDNWAQVFISMPQRNQHTWCMLYTQLVCTLSLSHLETCSPVYHWPSVVIQDCVSWLLCNFLGLSNVGILSFDSSCLCASYFMILQVSL